jgi:heme exporter protein D
MAEFLSMGGYGAYVWAAYAIFAVVLLIDALAPLWQRRVTLRDIAARLRRETARDGTLKNRPSGAREETR